jgi:hypothetical protein
LITCRRKTRQMIIATAGQIKTLRYSTTSLATSTVLLPILEKYSF